MKGAGVRAPFTEDTISRAPFTEDKFSNSALRSRFRSATFDLPAFFLRFGVIRGNFFGH